MSDNDKWVLFSEKKPTSFGTYLVTDNSSDGTQTVLPAVYKEGAETFVDVCHFEPIGVVAWMEFPNPYISKEGR